MPTLQQAEAPSLHVHVYYWGQYPQGGNLTMDGWDESPYTMYMWGQYPPWTGCLFHIDDQYPNIAQSHSCFFMSTHADRQGVDISFTVRVFVCLFVPTVTDFSAKDKASGVKFCTVVHRRPRQGICHFGELSSPRSLKSSPAPWLYMRAGQPWRGWRGHAHGPRVGSAGVDIRPSSLCTSGLVNDVLAFYM